MRRDEDGMADWMRATFSQACHSTWENVISHRLHNAYVSMSGVPGYDKNKLLIYNKAPYLHIRALYFNTEVSPFHDKGIEIAFVPQARTTRATSHPVRIVKRPWSLSGVLMYLAHSFPLIKQPSLHIPLQVP